MSNAEQSMQIYSIISQIEQMIEESPHPKFGSSTKRVVDLEEILDLLGDLKVTIPEDLRRANSLLVDSDTMIDNARENAAELVESAGKEADAMIRNANTKSDKILREAEAEFERKISEHEIMLEAQKRAQLLEKKAEVNAAIVYDGAKQYADEVLADIQKFLNNYQNSIMINRRELGVLQRPKQPGTEQAPAISQQSNVRPVQPGRQTQTAAARSVPVRPLPEEEEQDHEAIEEKRPKQPWWKLRFKGDYEDDIEEDFQEEEEIREVQTNNQNAKSKSRWNTELDVDLDEK